MKKYLSTILALLFVAFISTTAIAQDSKSESKSSAGKVEKKDAYDTKKDVQKKDIKKETKRREVKDKKQDKNKIGADESEGALTDYEGNDGINKGKPLETKKSELSTKEEKSNKGNAYGKNKGDLEGKEFGQDRALAAKSKNIEKKKELRRSLSDASSKINDANVRIKKARAGLERSYKDGEISEKEYKEKTDRIEKAEKRIKDLEEKIAKNKRLTN